MKFGERGTTVEQKRRLAVRLPRLCEEFNFQLGTKFLWFRKVDFSDAPDNLVVVFFD